MKIESSLHSAFRRMPPLVQSEKNWVRTVQRLPRRLKSIPMTRKADVPDILIILVNSAFHAKQKNCAERAVRINPHTNAVYAPECTLHCPDFIEDVCSVKNKPPYVCNGCGQLPKCTLLKRIYDPADAHERASSVQSQKPGQEFYPMKGI